MGIFFFLNYVLDYKFSAYSNCGTTFFTDLSAIAFDTGGITLAWTKWQNWDPHQFFRCTKDGVENLCPQVSNISFIKQTPIYTNFIKKTNHLYSFVLRFIELQGIVELLSILQMLDNRVANSPLHTSLIGCLKALMNNSVRRSFIVCKL